MPSISFRVWTLFRFYERAVGTVMILSDLVCSGWIVTKADKGAITATKYVHKKMGYGMREETKARQRRAEKNGGRP